MNTISTFSSTLFYQNVLKIVYKILSVNTITFPNVNCWSEMALMAIEKFVVNNDFYLFYTGCVLNVLTYNNIILYSYDRPAHKIMDKIAEHEADVCMVVVSNK